MREATNRSAEKDYIARSHERCRALGIDEGRVHSARILSDAQLFDKLEARRELVLVAEPFLNQLYDFVRGSSFFSMLTDADGCILSMIGDEAILSEAFALRMAPGAYMDEASIGTNAMGTCLAEGKPVQVSGDEHFVRAYHRWTCSSAPIRDADGAVVGAIDLTGYCENVHPHTLGMVVAAADAMGRMLEVRRYNDELQISNTYLEAMLDSISAGIVSIGLDGTVRTVNSHAAQMFGYDEESIRSMRAADLFEGWDEVRASLAAGQRFLDEDVLVKAATNKLQFNLSAYPILDAGGSLRDIILVFKDVKKVRKLANRIMGRRAIYTFDKIIGKNAGFLRTVAFAKKMADSRSTILIMGESGTGKELFAQAIHNYSDRRDEAFVAINCAAIPRSLIESELFGYEEGSFTGARHGGQPGKFEVADGGTVFLDEIGEMPLDMQTRLLRVIEEGTVCRIGSSKESVVNVRVIAATNMELEDEVDKGNFRKDLFYRLNVLPMRLPALRERKDDVRLLVDYFMDRITRKLNKRPVDIPPDRMRDLVAYDWPGNIRELENFVELAVNAEAIPRGVPFGSEPRAGLEGSRPMHAEPFAPPSELLSDLERRHIQAVLERHGGNVSEAAKALGIGRNTLYRKLGCELAHGTAAGTRTRSR
ncbi:MAG: sigma 54-interacting transcriptional regulator [Spirochaetes bacterium]|nr:sigma 54-interacting transcriptional regulator [Spirochaetota bacterium]MBU1081454.1 sigma 54-interacting transcriptional regulator [Spirochaetota bacterium]